VDDGSDQKQNAAVDASIRRIVTKKNEIKKTLKPRTIQKRAVNKATRQQPKKKKIDYISSSDDEEDILPQVVVLPTKINNNKSSSKRKNIETSSASKQFAEDTAEYSIKDLMELIIKEKTESQNATTNLIKKHEHEMKLLLQKYEQADQNAKEKNSKQLTDIANNFNKKIDIVLKEKDELRSELLELKQSTKNPDRFLDHNKNSPNNLSKFINDFSFQKDNNMVKNSNNNSSSSSFDSFAKLLILAKVASN
jgi:hypothetical protein